MGTAVEAVYDALARVRACPHDLARVWDPCAHAGGPFRACWHALARMPGTLARVPVAFARVRPLRASGP